MVKAIHASVKGRARYKIKGLYRSESLKKYIESRLSEKKEIIRFRVNSLTGNVLVFFNSDNNVHTIASLIEGIVIEYREAVHSHNPKKVDKNKSNLSEELRSKTNNSRSTYNRRKLRRAIINAKDQDVKPWHLMESEEILKIFNVDKNYGLLERVAKENLKEYGPNILPEAVPRSGFSIFIDQFKSLPVALLGVAAGISILTGGIADAIVIMGVVTINAFIGYFTESQADKTIHSLKNLVRPSAFVLREGSLKEVGVEEIVPGDILVLKPGSYVAADARLIESQHLSIDESALTGESMPVNKNAQALKLRSANNVDSNGSISDPQNFKGTNIPLADRLNMVYMGTLVTGGQGIAIVVATGRFTEIGKIQSLVGEARPPETPMERQLNKMGTQLVLIGSVICGAVFIIGLIRGYGFLHMLKTSISLAVAAVPEGLPTVATTTLALGIRNMKKNNVLIRHLDAVENLGSIQTMCLDKTGTITMNKMTVVSMFTGMKRIKIEGDKYILLTRDEDLSGKKAPLYRKDGFINPYQCDELLKLIHVSVICNESRIEKLDESYVINGSATENALLNLALTSGVDVIKIREKFPLLSIKHRSENRNFMVTVHAIKIPGSEMPLGKIIAVKGNPTEVLYACSFQLKDGKKVPLTEDDYLDIEIENERMAGNAMRVLGVAYAFIDDRINSWVNNYELGIETSKESIDIEFLMKNSDLIWLGLVGLADPIREGMKELIATFHRAGIDTIMITGDQSPTAYAIGKELGLSRGEPLEILDSTNLVNINQDTLKAFCKKVRVFARVSPAHKLQIVQALQSAGKVVAMTGDGVNDGPALKAADIGVAMGHTGTDLAREVADVVLEDDNLETMIIAISQGRTIYNNIRKSLHFLLSTNLSEIMVMSTAIAGGLGQPLTAMQLLWINLMSDIAPGLALALEPPEPDVLSRPPRDPNEPIIKTSDFKRITFESAILSAGALGAYSYGIARYGMTPRASTLAFISLSMGQILHSISCRSEKHTIFSREKLPPNRYLNLAIIGSLAIQILSIILPGLRGLLGLNPINIIDGIVITGGALAPLLINESTKVIGDEAL